MRQESKLKFIIKDNKVILLSPAQSFVFESRDPRYWKSLVSFNKKVKSGIITDYDSLFKALKHTIRMHQIDYLEYEDGK